MLKAKPAGMFRPLPSLRLLIAALLTAGLVALLLWPPGPARAQNGEPQQQQQTADYDTDDDGLIEVSSLAQLDAIRWDLDGDGASNNSGYAAAFPNPATGMGCPSAGCVGYELTADLDFDTNGSGEADAGDQYWNDGQGWLPIGRYTAVFEGNGHTIRNLYFRAEGFEPRGSGLFQALAETGVIRNVALKNVDLSGIPALKSSLGRSRIGGLVGENWGTISNAGVTGSVSGNWVIGGLVAWNRGGGTITDSYSSGEVSANGSKVGGLVGRNWGGRIVRSWSTANVTAGVGEYDISPYWGSGGGRDVGGLVGKSWHELGAGGDIIQASIVGSYATGRVRGGDRSVGGLVGANFGDIFASYATGDVSGGGWSLGGLVGYSEGVISASYALGAVSGRAVSGVAGVNGLVGVQHSHLVTVQRGDRRAGRNGHRCIDCEIPNAIPGHGDRSGITASYWNTQAPGQTASRGVNMSVLRLYGGPRCTGRTTAELRQPTDYTGIYALWDDLRDYSGDTYAWDFGTPLDFPVLRDTGPSVAAQRALLPDVPDQLDDPLDRNARLIARMYQLRNDSYYKSYARLWDRVLLALGVTVEDTTLTPMTAAEAQGYANTGWHDWRDVAYALSEPECPSQQQQQSAPPNQQQQQSAPPNQAPTVANAIADVSGLEAGATQDVSLSEVFSDADGDTLTITAASSDEAVATASVASDGSVLTLSGAAEGTATITVTAQDTDGDRVSDAFEAPVAKRYASLVAQMYQWRNDPCCAGNQAHTDRWDRALLAFGETMGDTTLSAMTADEAQTYADRGWTRWVEVTAALRELEAAGQQQQQGTPNQAPTVDSAIADATIVSESGTQQVSLSGVFSDADSDPLTITAGSSAETIATVSVASDYSSLTVTAKSRGTATITVTASDGKGGTVDDTFTVTVKAAPKVASAIGDMSGMEALASQEISLSGVFRDADGDTLTLSASSSDNMVVEPVLVGDTLTVYSLLEGTATITVTAQDSDGNTVSDAFDVSVGADQQQQQQQEPPPNQSPTVDSALSDVTIPSESGTSQVSLDGVFDDADGDSLTITAASSDETKATVSVASDYSTLTVSAKARGTATVTATAKDGKGGTVSDAFTVTVKAAPVVTSSIGDVSGLEEGSTQEISLSGVFSDADGDSLTITAASSDDAKATVTVAADLSKLTVAGVAEGTVTITVTARDADGNTVSDTFALSVLKEPEQDPPPDGETPNRAPTVAEPLADISLEGPPGWRKISLSGVFHDPDGDDLTITLVSSDHSVASTLVDGSTLTVLAMGTGTATITVTAEDSDGNTVSDAFEVTVTPAS